MAKEEFAVLTRSLASLRRLQIWPSNGDAFKDSHFSQIKYVLTFCSCSPLWIGILLHLIHVLKKGLDVNINEDIAMLSSMVGVHFIIISFVIKQKRVARLYHILSDFSTFGRPDHFTARSKQLDFYSMLNVIYCTVGAVAWGVAEILDGPRCQQINLERNLTEICGMWNIWTPFPIDYFPVKQLIFLMQLCDNYMIMFGAATISFTTLETAEHIVLRMKHLKRLLGEAFDECPRTSGRKRLNLCIAYHNDIIKIHEIFDACFQDSNGCYILMAALIFGCIANEMVQNFSLGALIHLGGWIMSLYARSHAGQVIISESLTIADAVLNSKWYEADLDLQRDLLMIMMRAQKSLVFHANPFGIMSYPLFLGLMKTSYSYFTLLNQTI